MSNNRVVLLPASSINFSPALAVQPVCDRPSPMIKRAAIIITVGLLNRLNVSLRFKMPKAKRLNIDRSAIMSGVNFPQMKSKIVTVRIVSIKPINDIVLN
jgi:hypothetical protein